MWQAVTGQDGKVYYYNSETGQSTWDKPEELFTDLERALTQTNWREYIAEGGHKYYYNIVNQQSVWTIPEEVQQLINQQNQQVRPPSGPRADRPYRFDRNTTEDQTAKSPEEAAKLFRESLENADISLMVSWDDALPKLVVQSGYWAVTSPLDRKQYFEEYKAEQQLKLQQECRKLQIKFHGEVSSDLKKFKDITYYTRWKTFINKHGGFMKKHQPIELLQLQGKSEDDQTYVEKEIRYAFEQYVKSIKAQHDQNQELVRKRDLEELEKSLETFNISWNTKWYTLKQHLEKEGIIKMLPRLNMLDILNLFEKKMKQLEREKSEQRQLERKLKYRGERKVRQEFVKLLTSLRDEGKIHSDSIWSNIVNDLANDSRFHNLCYQRTGSTPLELFWDIVAEEDQKVTVQREKIVDLLTSININVSDMTMTMPEFEDLVISKLKTIPKHNIKIIYNQIIKEGENHKEDRTRQQERDRYAHERRLRRDQDDFWHALKYVEPPLKATDTWENRVLDLAQLGEFKRLPDDEARRPVFDRYMRRLKDRERDRRTSSTTPSTAKRDNRGTSQGPYKRTISARGNDVGPYLEY